MLAMAALLLARADSAAQAADQPEPKKQAGYSIRVTLPIDGQTASRVKRFCERALEKAKAERAKPTLIFEFDVPAGQNEYGRGSQFGAAYELANFLSSDDLNAAVTVAYLPKSIEGHAVLPAMACEQIIMAPRCLDRRGRHRREDDQPPGAQRVHGDRRPAAHRAGSHRLGHARSGRLKCWK